ncbi:MAG: hypothetical protein U0L33_04100 [Acutalibacteraceae bacterium]|nr:hypothetical protein [Acutalibacteraceae bacterium]
MKKVLSIVLCMLMLCGLTACRKSNISSEFSSYYINAKANTDKDNFEEVEIVEVIEENVENKNENANNDSTNESSNISENNNSNNSNTSSNTESKVETPVVPSTPVVEELTTPSTPATPSEPQYKTLKLHEKTTYIGLEGCFAYESEVWELDLKEIGIANTSDADRGYFCSEYYNVDTNEPIYFVQTFGPLSDSYLSDIMQADRVPVKVQ